MMVSGGGVFGRWLGHESRVLMDRIRTLIKEAAELSRPFPHVRTQQDELAVNQEVGSHQTPNPLET